MATENRSGPAKDAVGQQTARLRRSAPGKRLSGRRAGQARQARRQQLDRVVRTAAKHRREEREEASVTGILVELFVDSLRLASSLITAPLRIREAARRSQRTEARAGAKPAGVVELPLQASGAVPAALTPVRSPHGR